MNKLNTKPVLPLAAAKAITAGAEAEAERNNWAVAIAVVDDAGGLIHFIKMDDTKNSAVEIAQKKAIHAANYRRETLFDEKVLKGGSIKTLSLPNSMPIEGGIPLVFENVVVGAIGVSGLTSEEDGRVAQKGIEAFVKWLAI